MSGGEGEGREREEKGKEGGGRGDHVICPNRQLPLVYALLDLDICGE